MIDLNQFLESNLFGLFFLKMENRKSFVIFLKNEIFFLSVKLKLIYFDFKNHHFELDSLMIESVF